MTDLTPLPETGEPKSNARIETPAQAINIYTALKTADELSAQNRAVVQAMLDGAPPYSDDTLMRTGASWRSNINFNEGAAMLDAALTSYQDLVDAVEMVVKPYLPITVGDPTSRKEMEDVIGESFDQMLKSWPEFQAYYSRLICEMLAHGVSFALFVSDEGWKWQPAGFDDCLIPRTTEATEEAIDVMIYRRETPIHKLYRKIADAEKASGWDVNEVRKTIVAATRGKKDTRGWTHDWAMLERELKNNDLEVSYAKAQTVPLLHFWTRGFNGRISHHITTEELCGKSPKFLYTRIDKFEQATNAFVSFTNSISFNGCYHAIRGLGYRLFPLVQGINRLRCAMLDGAAVSSSLFLQPKQDADMDSPPISFNGPIGYLSPDWSAADVKFTNPAEGVLSIIRELQTVTQANTGTYKASAVNPTANEKTRYEIMAQQELESALSVSAVNMFYRSWRRLVQEMFRRVQQIRPTDKHFPEVVTFYKRCAERGVLPDIVKQVDRVEPVKAVGFGSAQQRQLALTEAMELIGSFDEAGRNALIRDKITARFGKDMADRYVPKIEQPRPVIDETIAELENAALRNGTEISARDGQNHAVHARIHMEAMLQEVQGWEEARLNNELDFENIQPRLAFVEAALVHVEPHIDALGQDNTRKVEFGQYRKAYQQVGAMLEGFIASYQRYLRDNRRQSEAETPDTSPEAQEALRQKQLLNEMELAKQRESADIALGKKAEDVRLDIEKKRVLADIDAAKAVAKSPVA